MYVYIYNIYHISIIYIIYIKYIYIIYTHVNVMANVCEGRGGTGTETQIWLRKGTRHVIGQLIFLNVTIFFRI